MSSLDRAFFRAYAKDQPAETPASPQPELDVSPYVHFESRQRPQLRYRIEPAQPWGQSIAPAPHSDMSSAALPIEEDVYPLAPPTEEPELPSAWSAQPVLHLHTRQYELTTTAEPPRPTPPRSARPAPPIEKPAAKTTPPPGDREPDTEGIVCLPGVDLPPSDYLATLLTQAVDSVQYVDTLLQQSAIVAPPKSEEPLPADPIVEDLELLIGAIAPLAAAPVAAPTAIEPAAVEAVPIANKQPAVLSPSATDAAAAPSPAAENSVETTVLWEVDHYLYPEVSDRLLREYAYFQQAGDKLKQASAAGLKVLAITGVERDEGRTTLAITMARAAAQAGLQVGLIDCDFQRPQLAAELGLDVASGWHLAATGNLDLAEVTVRSLDDGILLLPLTEDAAKSSLHWSDDAVRRVVEQTAASLDVVVLDLGPLGPTGLASRKKLPFDAAIVVWDCRHRPLQDAQAIARRLTSAGVEAVGIAENYSNDK